MNLCNTGAVFEGGDVRPNRCDRYSAQRSSVFRLVAV
jgi:hypothetical protein